MNQSLTTGFTFAISRGLNKSNVEHDLKPGSYVCLNENATTRALGNVGRDLRSGEVLIVVSEVFEDRIDFEPTVLVGTVCGSDYRLVRANNLVMMR